LCFKDGYWVRIRDNMLGTVKSNEIPPLEKKLIKKAYVGS